jgi:hypothetical protein
MRRNVSLAKPPRGRQAELRETGGLIALGSSLSLSSLGETGRTGSLFPHCATHDAMPSLFVCEWRSRGERERRGKYRMDYSCCWWRYVRGKAQHRSTVISCRGQSQHGTPQKKRKTRAWMATTPLLPLCTPLSLDHLTPTTLTRLRLSLRIVRTAYANATAPSFFFSFLLPEELMGARTRAMMISARQLYTSLA